MSVFQFQEQCNTKSKEIVEKLQTLISSPSSAAAEAAPAPANENGLPEPEIDGVTLSQLGKEYVLTILEPTHKVVVRPLVDASTQFYP